jgi:energy-coupling factor transport system ATP-binding protein
VADECSTADAEHGLEPGTTASVVGELIALDDVGLHPHDLSEGQRLSLVLGIVLAPRPEVLLLDEPTRGLDYEAKRRLVTVLRSLREDGIAIVLATHDVELVASVADRALVLAQGELIADGPAREVVSQTPAFAPQVAKILRPLSFLTVSEVHAAL